MPRGRGLAGRLLDTAVKDMKTAGTGTLYLITDHSSFYEKYGREFFCMAQPDDEPEKMRIYIYRC